MGRRVKYLTRNNFVFASEFDQVIWANSFPVASVAKWCCRDVRTIWDWRSGARPCPRWAFDLVLYRALDLAPGWRLRLYYPAWVDLRWGWFGGDRFVAANDVAVSAYDQMEAGKLSCEVVDG